MGLTEEQRARMNQLRELHKKAAWERSIAKERARIAECVENFTEKYAFADENATEMLNGILNEMPFTNAGRLDLECFPEHREVSVDELSSRMVWICFLMGSPETFEIYVSGELGNVLGDYDGWYSISPYLLLMYGDLVGFLYIDDDGNMTKVVLETNKDGTKEE